MADPNVLKQYIFQKGFVTEATKQKRQQEAANSTLQVGARPGVSIGPSASLSGLDVVHVV